MKKQNFLWIVVILTCLAVPLFAYQNAGAGYVQAHGAGAARLNPQVAATLLPTPSAVIEAGYPTPTPRTLPPVGSNAGLVIGASVLVLIIIGGVLSGRLRQKH